MSDLFPAGPAAQIISASRRTDLPRCYPGLLAGWLRQGWVDVPNPFNRRLRRVPLAPEAVHTLVLWSKDFSPLLANAAGLRDLLANYHQAFFYLTVTGLGGTAWEPGVPDPGQVSVQFDALARLAGDPRRVVWRFDPMVFWREGRAATSNLARFARIAARAQAAGLTRVVVSLCQWYAKAQRRAAAAGRTWFGPRPASLRRVADWLQAAASRYGLLPAACCSPELEAAGITPGRCIDAALLNRLHPQGWRAVDRKDPGQRKACGCTLSADIGSYDLACPAGCCYCYANPV